MNLWNWLTVLTFRSQLSLILVLLLGSCVAGMLGIAQYYFRHHIENFAVSQLHQERQVLLQTLRDRGETLYREAHGVAARVRDAGWFAAQSRPLTLAQLREKNFLPADSATEVVVVMRETDQRITASTRPQDDGFLSDLRAHPALTEALQGIRRFLWLHSDEAVYQIATVTIPGTAPAAGTVFLARRLAWAELPLFGLYSGQSGFVIFNQAREVLLTHSVPRGFSELGLESLLADLAFPSMDTVSGGVHTAGFAYLLDFSTPQELPPFLLLRTLDGPFSFWEQARWFILLIVIGVGGLAAFFVNLFNRHLQNTLSVLHTAVEQVERENYAYRLELPGNDDFSELAHSANEMMHTLEEQQLLYKAMEQVVGRDVAQRIVTGELRPDGEERQLTVLTVNMRGFNEVNKSFPASELLSFLNDYFTRIYYCVEAHGGVVDKYFGDSLIALFGFDGRIEKGLLAALESAQEMLDAMVLFNLEVADAKELHVDIGIGIAYGSVISGNIGAFERRSYSVIGSTVKQALQMQELTGLYGVSILLDRLAANLLARCPREARAEMLPRNLNSTALGSRFDKVECCEILPRRYRPEELSGLIHAFETAQAEVRAARLTSALPRLRTLAAKWPEDRPTRILLEYCQSAVRADSDRAGSSETPQPAAETGEAGPL